MMNIAYFNIVRPKNLAIVVICQVVIYYFIIQRYLVSPALDIFLFGLLVIDTVLIAASGYVINDIKDHQSDQLNKPQATYTPSLISLSNARIYYWILVGSGAIIALYVAYSIDNIPLFFIYPLAVGLLYIYAFKYKSSVLVGNVLVSLFVSFVPGIVFFAERQTITTAPKEISSFVIEVLFAYMVFSFLVNMIREIIKDIEDVRGDQAYETRTVATAFGVEPSKEIALGFVFLTMISVILWLALSPIGFDLRFISFVILFIVLPLLLISQIILKHSEKRDFSKISKILKTIMLVGLLSIVFLTTSTDI